MKNVQAYMWPLSLKAGERGDALQGTLSTPLTQHIAKLRQNSACAIKIWIILFNNKKSPQNYLSVRFCCNGCTFCWLFHGGFLFSSGFGDLCSHAFVPTKGPNRWNEWTKTASFLPRKIKSKADSPFCNRGISTESRWPQRDVRALAQGKSS